MGVGIRHVVPCGDVQEMSKKTGEAVILYDGSESEAGRARRTAHLFVDAALHCAHEDAAQFLSERA